MKKTMMIGAVLAVALTAGAENLVTVRDIPYYPAGTELTKEMKEKCLLDVRYDKDAGPGRPVVIWMHGGAYKLDYPYIEALINGKLPVGATD